MPRLVWCLLLAGVAWPAASPAVSAAGSPPPAPCRIEVVEHGSGWPVPLVELRTTHQLRFVTDNAGRLALDAPELLGKETWFDIHGHGYDVPADGFGYRGVRLTPRPGETLRVEVHRTLPARRLGRLTGAARLAESRRLGLVGEEPETGVLGCDSIQAAVYRDQLHCFWGDTTLARYPLGIFQATGATVPRRPMVSWEPPLQVHFDVFRDPQGLPRGIAPMPGSGPTWISGVAVVDDPGNPRLVCSYAKIRPPLDAYEWGLALWDDSARQFRPDRVVWTRSEKSPKPPPVPEGHVSPWQDRDGRRWLLFGNPFPTLRCPATLAGWRDSNQWEVLTPQPKVAPAGGGEPIQPHSGSIAWNDFRRRWVTVFLQAFGKPSAFGELWYAEAESPTGPWGPAVKVLSHDNYTFYNPRLHPEWTGSGSPILLFEGTYTRQFADRPAPTPRYDYNQILYRLDLDDPALLPARSR